MTKSDVLAIPKRANLLAAIYEAVDSVNETLTAEGKLEANEGEYIIGEGAKIDSLGFISLVLAVEAKIANRFGSSPSLIEDLSDPDVGVCTLGQLADFLIVHSDELGA